MAENIHVTINNESLGRRAIVTGVDDMRDFLRASEVDGLHVLPHIRSRFMTGLAIRAAVGKFINNGLIASGQQPYSPTLREAWEGLQIRLADEKAKDPEYQERPLTERRLEVAKQFARNVGEQRITTSPVRVSDAQLQFLQELADTDTLGENPRFFATMFPEKLEPDEVYHDANTVRNRAAVLTPDLIERVGGVRVESLLDGLSDVGIGLVAVNSLHMSRRSFTGESVLPKPESYIPDIARQGKLRQLQVALSPSGLPPATQEARVPTNEVKLGLLDDKPVGSAIDDLRRVLNMILENKPPEAPLDITISGKLGKLSTAQVAQIAGNLRNWATQG